jgi:hypothetical protein
MTQMHYQGQTYSTVLGERPFVLHHAQPAVQLTAKNIPLLWIIIHSPTYILTKTSACN